MWDDENYKSNHVGIVARARSAVLHSLQAISRSLEENMKQSNAMKMDFIKISSFRSAFVILLFAVVMVVFESNVKHYGAIMLLTKQDHSVQFLILEQSKTNGSQSRSHSLITSISNHHPDGLISVNNQAETRFAPSWLAGSRLGNVHENNETSAFSLFLGDDKHTNTQSISSILQETICFNSSRWVTDNTDSRLWTTRLVYLAAYWHQHAPAMEEKVSSTFHVNQGGIRDVGPFDYECSKSRFLVVPMSSKGIGANFRLTAVSALKAAIATNRIAIFANNISIAKANSAFKSPWPLASCPRSDIQCTFRSSSPCVLLHKDIANANVLSRNQSRQLFRHGITPPEYEDDRVLGLNLPPRQQRHPSNLRSLFYNISKKLISLNPALQSQAATEGLNRLLKPVSNASSLFQGDQEITNGLMMYALRPLPTVMKEIDGIVRLVTKNQNVTSTSSVGLPIRGELL